MSRLLWLTLTSLLATASHTGAQTVSRAYAGVLFGVSVLSADARSTTSNNAAGVSLYSPENGSAANLFAGYHLSDYFTVQANYMWNRNDVTLYSSFSADRSGGFYQQSRQSSQHAAVVDGLIYFRELRRAIRPYLGTGLSVFHFSSRPFGGDTSAVLTPPPTFASTKVALRSAVGVDIALSPRLSLRYTFSETISRNPISPHLEPPGQRRLANFQNLIGVLGTF